MSVASLLLTLLFVAPPSDVDEATRARVEAWLDGFCEDVVGGGLLSPDVMDGGAFVDLDALQARVRALGRERGRDVNARIKREAREEYVADFVSGSAPTDSELLSVERVDPRTVHARIWVDQPEFAWSVLVRLRDGADGLRAVDWLSPDVGMWASEELLVLNGLEGLAARTASATVMEALAYVGSGDVDLAREVFARVPDVELPGTLASFRDTVESFVRSGEGDAAGAREAIARALAHERVAPLAWHVASTHAVDDGDYARGLELSRVYLEHAPGDTDGVEQLAWAHLGLGHTERARELALQVLARRPHDEDVLQLAFLGWAFADELERRESAAALAELLHRDDDPLAMGLLFFDAAWWHADTETIMARVVELAERADCCPELALYGRAYQAWWIDDWETVVALLQHEVDDLEHPVVRGVCADLLAEAHLTLGDPLAAYASAPDPATGFRNASQHLIDFADDWKLAALIATYETEDGADRDPWLELARGHVFWLAGDPRKAELAFVRAEQLAGDDWEAAELAFEQRLSLRWEQDDLAGAYDEIEPQAEVLATLLTWCDHAEDEAGLAELLELHADDGEPHGSFPAAKTQLRLLRGEDEQAVDTLLQRRALFIDTWGQSAWEGRTIGCLVRLGRVDEAVALAEDSTARDGDPWFEVWVHIRARHADAAVDAIERWLDTGWGEADVLWYQTDLIDDLRSEELQAVRDRFPEPER